MHYEQNNHISCFTGNNQNVTVNLFFAHTQDLVLFLVYGSH